MWPAKSAKINLLSLGFLELNVDLSHPSQGALSSDGIWKVKAIPNGKGETCPDAAGWRSGRSRNIKKGTFPLLFL